MTPGKAIEMNTDPLDMATAKEMVRETINETFDEQLALYDVLVVTDVMSLQRHTDFGGSLDEANVRVAVVPDPADPLAADKLMLRWAQAGKEVVTWCSMTDEGRRVAREVASTLNPHLKTAAGNGSGSATRVRHIVKDPRDWQPLVDPFDGLLAGARKTVPSAPRRSSGGDGKSAAARDDDYDVTSLRSAERLLLAHPDRLLVVTDSQNALSDLYVLAENGVWQRGDVILRGWMGELADELRIKAVVHDKLDGSPLNSVLQRIRRLAEPDTLKPIREQAATALQRLIHRGELSPGDVTTCLDTDLDADMRYLGTPTGVVDLHTATRLSPAEGRHHLVTLQTPVAFEPEATHEDVDRLFGHLPEVLQKWFWDVMGYHLLGYPSRRFYVVEGPKGGGKSTLANALEAVLGSYASRPQDTALEAPRASAGLSPEIEKLTTPRRFALFVELTIRKVSGPQMKRFCGDDSQTLRKPYKDEITARLTATMLLFCNPGSVPHLRLQDDAMADRLQVLPYPSIPVESRDPLFTRRVQTDEKFKQAFLARLVAAAARQEPGVPPEPPPEVAAATAERVRDDVGELGAFARRLVRDADSKLPFAELWEAWCEYNEEDPTSAVDPGGITKRRFSGALRNFVPRLPAARQLREGKRRIRGFLGWRLMTVEEAEAAAAAAAEQQAEATEPEYVPGPEAEQAIRGLLAGFPDDFSVLGVVLGREALYESLVRLGNDQWPLALRDKYKDGHQLTEHLEKARKAIAYYDPRPGRGNAPMSSPESMRLIYPDWDDRTLAAWWLYQTVFGLAWMIYHNRPAGPAYERAKARFKGMAKTTLREEIALNHLLAAARRSGSVETDDKVLERKAVELLREGSDYTQKWDCEFDADIEAAIKELLGLQEPSAGERSESHGADLSSDAQPGQDPLPPDPPEAEKVLRDSTRLSSYSRRSCADRT